MSMTILDRVKSPADLRGLSRDELNQLASDLRTRLVDVCSRTGGHIGAGLGVVELTIALHYVYDFGPYTTRSTRHAISWSGTSATRAIPTSSSRAATTKSRRCVRKPGFRGFSSELKASMTRSAPATRRRRSPRH